ncbi:hypothetical protein J4458_01535 [Candidatus Woesearchaeota archaeon]|nr:hypothetical protein [Candidatus Woesearchaeota archaeon]
MTLQVVKVGSSSIVRNGSVAYQNLDRLCYEIAEMRYKDRTDTVLVVSGAIPLGMSKKGISKRPEDKAQLQSCARAGQPELMRVYNDAFATAGKKGLNYLIGSEYLVTYDNLATPKRRKLIVDGINLDVSQGQIPLINYNDGVDPEEAQKDNDRLAAEIAKCINAERLIILGVVGGVMKDNRIISEIDEITDEIMQLDEGAGENGTGGLTTKLEAAKIVMPEGIHLYMGNVELGIRALIERKSGTYFKPKSKRFF